MLNDNKILKITLVVVFVAGTVFSSISAYRYQQLSAKVADFHESISTAPSEEGARSTVLSFMENTGFSNVAMSASAQRANTTPTNQTPPSTASNPSQKNCQGWSRVTCAAKFVLRNTGLDSVNKALFPEGRDLIQITAKQREMEKIRQQQISSEMQDSMRRLNDDSLFAGGDRSQSAANTKSDDICFTMIFNGTLDQQDYDNCASNPSLYTSWLNRGQTNSNPNTNNSGDTEEFFPKRNQSR